MEQGIKLEDVACAFARWRQDRKPGARIPDTLWAQASEAAEAHGMTATAHRLGLNHSQLKRRSKVVAPVSTPEFVELPLGGLPLLGHESVVEVEDASGSRLRLVLRGVSAGEVAAAAKELWSVTQ